MGWIRIRKEGKGGIKMEGDGEKRDETEIRRDGM